MWKRKALGEITSYMAKGIPPKYVNVETPDTIKVLNQKCNRNFQVSYKEARLHDNSAKKVPEDKMLRPGDILINSTGAGTAGRIAQIWNIPSPTTIDGHMILIRSTDEVDPLYFGYALKGYQSVIESFAEGSTGQTEINKTRLQNEIIISFPADKNLQQKIGATLLNIDDKIKTNEDINQNLNEQVQALFKSWFVDFEPFSGSIPHDWKNIIFAEILTPVTEKSNDEKIPMYSVTDTGLYPRDKKFKKKLSMTNAKCKVIRNNDLVFGMSREILNWGVMHEPLGRVSAAYNVYHVSNDVDSYYLEHYIKAHSQYFKDLIRPASREGQGIDKALLMEKEIYLPSKAVLDHYYEIENPIIEFINSCEEENIYLESLRDTLLPRLMSGELDIANIDI